MGLKQQLFPYIFIIYSEFEACYTCGMRGMETLPLDRGVGVERQVHLVPTSGDWTRGPRATELAKTASSRTLAIKYLHMVVRALLMGLQLEVVEHLEQKKQMSHPGSTMKKAANTSSCLPYSVQISLLQFLSQSSSLHLEWRASRMCHSGELKDNPKIGSLQI